MRALKSVLGLPLLHETHLIGGRRRSIAEIISDFITELRHVAEASTGRKFNHVLSGRPVHFHSGDPTRDAQAEDDLRACYRAAGFEHVTFLAEPEAAAIACHHLGASNTTGLVVDIGGGTSDFSVFRSENGHPRILASHGIRLGGTDFDKDVSLAHAMDQLGLGGALRREMGTGLLPVPRAPFVDLATWAKIPFLYAPEMRRQAAAMARVAVDQNAMDRLVTVLEHELGHELAFAVEAGKIDANAGDGTGRINMGFIEQGLSARITARHLDRTLAAHRASLIAAASETIAMADLRHQDIGRIILVGGSSLMRFVSDGLAQLCPTAKILPAKAFTAVIDGLAMAACTTNDNAV